MSNFPIRCFTCAKVINPLWVRYQEGLNNGENAITVLNRLKISRMCCRRMFLSHVDIDDVLGGVFYPVHKDRIERMVYADDD